MRNKASEKPRQGMNAIVTVVKTLEKSQQNPEARIHQLEREKSKLLHEKQVLNSFLARIGFDGNRLIDTLDESAEPIYLLSMLHAFRLEIDMQHPNMPQQAQEQEEAMIMLEELLMTRHEDRPREEFS